MGVRRWGENDAEILVGFIPHTSALCLLFIKRVTLGSRLKYHSLRESVAVREKGESGDKG